MMRRLLLDQKVILALYVFLYTSSFFLSTNHSIICLGDDSLDDDFLSEILAEEARHEEEAARMEAEAREYEAMQARQYSECKLVNIPNLRWEVLDELCQRVLVAEAFPKWKKN